MELWSALLGRMRKPGAYGVGDLRPPLTLWVGALGGEFLKVPSVILVLVLIPVPVALKVCEATNRLDIAK